MDKNSVINNESIEKEKEEKGGGGLLIELMKQAAQTKQYAELDHAIKTKVEPFLYNKGQGRKIPIWKLVLLRNKDRPRYKMLKNESVAAFQPDIISSKRSQKHRNTNLL
ncbi:hypothetical protein PGB90_009537 [Kerria lacca]